MNLSLLEAAQAQKHVTVNEALSALDALSQLVIASRSRTAPPPDAAEGTVYAVPEGAQAPWDGAVGQLASLLNGGWVFFAPRAGWRAWLAEEGTEAVFDGTAWRSVRPGSAPSGAGLDFTPVEIDHQITSGASSQTSSVIPAGSLVLGVTGRVTEAITGTLTTWRLGVAGGENRYGSGLGLAVNSYVLGLTGSPVAYYTDTRLRLEAEAGIFVGGRVTLVVHLVRLGLPNPV